MKWNSIMAHNLALSNNLQDLSVNIATRHISYLCEDKSLEKLKHLNILQNCINELIFKVPHRHKFSFPETADILHRSVCSSKFNALKAAAAWLSLSTYANNLYSQPWRKEYNEIKLYSGFYKHQIENCLTGAEAILELMGYKRVSGDKMVIEEPVNLNKLAATSLDSLKAVCECQVLFSVYKEISKHIPAITWADILHIREQYTGSPEQTINAIVSLYAYSAECCTDCYFNYPQYQTPATSTCRKCARPQAVPTCPPLNGYRSSAYHPSISSTPRYPHSAPTIPPADYLPLVNGYYQHHGHSHHHHHQVPTAKLIDYEDTLDGYPHSVLINSAVTPSRRHISSASVVDRWNWSANCTPSSSARYQRAADSRCLSSSSPDSASYEDSVHNRSSVRPSMERNVGISIAGAETVGSGVPAAISISNSSHNSTRKRDQSTSSEVSLRAGKSVVANEVVASRSNNCSAGAATAAVNSSSSTAACHKPEPNTMSAATHESSASTPTWGCSNCTFYNSQHSTVCEMCGKSRNASAEAPLFSGGKQCKYCTLVNKKEATQCEACEGSLENSPTYV